MKLQSSSSVTKPELLIVQFVAEHNFSASLADHFQRLSESNVSRQRNCFSDVRKFYYVVVRKMIFTNHNKVMTIWLYWNKTTKLDKLAYAPIVHLAEHLAPLVDKEVFEEEFEDH